MKSKYEDESRVPADESESNCQKGKHKNIIHKSLI